MKLKKIHPAVAAASLRILISRPVIFQMRFVHPREIARPRSVDGSRFCLDEKNCLCLLKIVHELGNASRDIEVARVLS